jgi:hypothetical protein
MRVPQVSERIKEVPAQALRGVFAGIGQLLLITDKLRNKTPVDAAPPRARTPERPNPVADEPAVAPEKAPEPAAAPPAGAKSSSVKSAPAKPARREASKPPPTPRTRDFDKTGNVRLLDDAETSAAAPVSPVPAETAAPETAAPETAAHAGAPGAGSEPGDSGPPLPNYDELSVASLRARLRNLDVAQVRQLAEYERAHAARAEVVTMFERRIAKLEADV